LRSARKVVVRSPSTKFQAMHALSSSDVWIAGERGKILEERPVVHHWDGRRLRELLSLDIGSAEGGSVTDVAPLSANDDWFAGSTWSSSRLITEQRLLAHWDGARWANVVEPQLRGRGEAWLDRLVAVAPNDVWAFGSSSEAAGGDNRFFAQHWDGTRWTVVSMPTHTEQKGGKDDLVIHDASAISHDDVWVVGEDHCGPSGLRRRVRRPLGRQALAVGAPSPRTLCRRRLPHRVAAVAPHATSGSSARITATSWSSTGAESGSGSSGSRKRLRTPSISRRTSMPRLRRTCGPLAKEPSAGTAFVGPGWRHHRS
jgi:hypothetical protein